MSDLTIVTALNNLNLDGGWVANDVDGIVLWERDEPQPTEAELIAAGWIKPTPGDEPEPEPEEENPTE